MPTLLHRKTHLLICLFLLSFSSNAQRHIDSLSSALQRADDSVYVSIATELSEAYVDEKKLKQGFDYLDSALAEAKQMKSPRMEAYVYNNYGNLYNYVNNVNKALDHFEKALKIYEKIGYAPGLRSVYLNRGNTYFANGEYAKAEASYTQALKLNIQLKKDATILADIYNNLGGVCGAQGKFQEANSYFNNALDIYKQMKDSASMAYGYNNLGIIQQNLNNYQAALPFFEKALQLKLRFGTTAKKAEAYQALADNYSELDMHPQALENLKLSLEYTDTTVFNIHLKRLYEAMARAYEQTGNLTEANRYYKLLQRINSEVLEQEIAAQIASKDLMFDFSRVHLSDSLSQVSQIREQESEIKRSNTIRYFLLLVVALIIIFLALLYKRYKLSKQQQREISRQKSLVDEKQKEILDSINYAKKIQETVLNKEHLDAYFPEHFILFRPKDIVSGDFYWTAKVSGEKELFFFAVCDSTGHGVPGAFMSLLNINFLNEAINEKHIHSPERVLEYVREKLTGSISKENQKDGFDGILLCFDKSSGDITYAAANNYPLLVSEDGLQSLPFDRMPVGKGLKPESFRLHTLEYKKGDQLFLVTDGYADQFGGEKGKKFMSKALKQLLLSMSAERPDRQLAELNSTFDAWKGMQEQVDDVTIAGLKL